MSGVHAIESASIGPEHFDGFKGRHRPDHDRLLLHLLPSSVDPMAAGSSVEMA